MDVTTLSASTPFRRASSRTFTEPTPLPDLQVLQVMASPQLDQLYGGPPVPGLGPSAIPGTVRLPTLSGAVQIFGTGGSDAAVTVMLDLGEERDIARIELYGNLLLPPLFDERRPVHNYGLPRAMAVAVAEGFNSYTDIHGRTLFEGWVGAGGDVWHPRHRVLDLRALCGWTSIHLPATYGRYLLLHFWDLPQVGDDSGVSRPGLDIQRLVVYPFLEDSDHHSSIEYAPLSSCQNHYSAPSNFWGVYGVGSPQPADHHSQHLVFTGEAMLPSALVGLAHETPAGVSSGLYASDTVRPDTDDRILLTVAATTDEVPLISGVGLTFEQMYLYKMGGNLPDYLISVEVTNDPEAAWSAEVDNPAWSQASSPRLVRASTAEPSFGIRLMFATPQYARYVRLVVQVISTNQPEEEHRFVLSGLALIRPRDFYLTPEPGEDLQLDHVLIRLHGPHLFDDHAYVDGRNGMGLTLEVEDESGAFRTVHSFRSLLSLLENAQTRTFVNSRFSDKPIQLLTENVQQNSTSEISSESSTDGENESTVLPDFGNRQVSASASVTRHTRLPQTGIDGDDFPSMPAGPLESLETRRWYAGPRPDTADVVAPIPSFFPPDLGDQSGPIDEFLMTMESSGRPVTLSVGINGGLAGTGGIQVGAGVSVTPSGGASLSASSQLGGGTTHSHTLGDQGTAVKTESKTVEAYSKQATHSRQTSKTQQQSVGDTTREIERHDHSEERRRAGVNVHYGGAAEDILLAAVPVGVRLAGPENESAGSAKRRGRVFRVRVDHLPRGVRIDVEFRGSKLSHRYNP